MKKLCVASLMLLLLLLAVPALAQDAADITAEAKIVSSSRVWAAVRATDRDYSTAWTSDKERYPSLEITSKTPCYGLYVCFGEDVKPWNVQVLQGKKWTTVATGDGLYAHEYLPLDGLTHFRITYDDGTKCKLSVTELYLLSQGDVPAFVQRWQPTVEKADLMLLVAHPDDEILTTAALLRC